MAVTLRPTNPRVVLQKVEEPGSVPISPGKASVRLYPTNGNVIELGGRSEASVGLVQVLEPDPPQIILNGATAPAVSVVLGLTGPKGDPGIGGGGGGAVFDRVNADISGIWGDTFYVQDATPDGDWRITRIDGQGNSTLASSDDSDHAGLSTIQAWTNRASLTYT